MCSTDIEVLGIREFADRRGCRAASSAQEAVFDVDVVVTATSAATPVLHGNGLKPNAHVNAVGAPRPDWRELDDAIMRARVIVDSRVAANSESGDAILSSCQIAGELGEVVMGRS